MSGACLAGAKGKQESSESDADLAPCSGVYRLLTGVPRLPPATVPPPAPRRTEMDSWQPWAGGKEHQHQTHPPGINFWSGRPAKLPQAPPFPLCLLWLLIPFCLPFELPGPPLGPLPQSHTESPCAGCLTSLDLLVQC